MSFTERYRPETFEEVVGQSLAVQTLKRLVLSADPPPLLLVGPYGTGKTTLARIYARALNCTALTPTGSPCLKCAPCSAFGTREEFWFYTEVSAATHGGKDDTAYFEELSRISPMWDVRQRVIFFDEAHGMSRASQDLLLRAFETTSRAAFVLATTEPERLTGALASRCHCVSTRLLSQAEMIDHGLTVCARESITAEPEAMQLLAAAADGHMRKVVMDIERLSFDGALRRTVVASGLNLDWGETALRAILALARGDLAGARATLHAWTAQATVKAAALRDALVHVAHMTFTPARSHPDAPAAFLLAAPALVDEVTSALNACAGMVGTPPLPFVWALAEHWARRAPLLRDEGDLEVELLAAAHSLWPADVSLAPLPPLLALSPTSPRSRARRRRPTDEAPAKGQREAYVTKRIVTAEYRAATMLPQAYGLWFNTRLRLRWRDYGVVEVDAALKLFSDLTHELGMRLRHWGGDPAFLLHWLAQHEVDDASSLVTWLLVSIPAGQQERAREWAAERLPVGAGVLVNTLGTDVWRAPDTTGRAAAVHWSLMRELWRAIDQAAESTDEAGRRRPLKELLLVPPQRPRDAGVLPDDVRRFSSSKSLGPRVWKAAEAERFGFLSALEAKKWEELPTGWEADEFEHRALETQRRAGRIAEIEAQHPPGVSPLTDVTCEQRIRAFFEFLLPFDPTRRPRLKRPW